MKNKTDITVTGRRGFIQQLALCYVAAQLPLTFFGCKSDEEGFVGSGKPPYKVWEEMLMALKTSPDHLEGRMNILTASKDAEAMFNFVRDEIYLIPTHPTHLKGIGTQLRWGMKGVLRYGVATPREKAELLNKMYKDAGLVSKVVYEGTDIQIDEVPALFFRPISRGFNLDLPKKQWKQWQKELQIENADDYKIPVYDADFEKTNALAEQLWQQLPNKEKLDVFKFDYRWDNYRTPTVEFEHNGEKKYAHLFDKKIPFGSLKNDVSGRISPADPVKSNEEKVSISISYRDAVDTTTEKELVSGEWLATQLVGNQINMAFMHGLTLEQQVVTQIGSVRIFTPALAFQSFDEELQVMGANSFVGDPFTLDGKRIDVSGEEATINGVAIGKKPDEALQKKVQKLEVKAIPANYPLVKLNVTPTDSDGNFVENLAASDFSISDNDNQVQALMESNRPTPRILLLYDTSGSMPNEYVREKMEFFIASLHQKIVEKYPAAVITKWKTPSELFTWLLKASKTDYDLIIYATDGDNNDTYRPEDEKTYRSGPPAIILDVYDTEAKYKKESFEKMAEVTNGILIQAKDQIKTLDVITDYVEKMEIPPYVFTYYATEATKSHTVIIGIDKNRITESDTFNFVKGLDKKEAIGQNLIGLYCTVKAGNTTTKRVLAGWDPITQRDVQPDYSHFLEVRNTIFDGATIYVEGEGPTISAGLSDILKYRLTTRSWGEALIDDNLENAKENFRKGGYKYHPQIMPLMAPLEAAVTTESMTFASGIRMGIVKNKIGIGESASKFSFDYLPTSNYVTLTKNSNSAFHITLQKTAQLAIRESHYFTKSTLSELKNSRLIELQKAIEIKWFHEEKATLKNQYYWKERIHRGDGNFKIFDDAAVNLAYWQINQKTGELFGMLADGTGGGSEEIIKQLTEIMAVISLYIIVLQEMGILNGMAGLALSVVGTYGLTLTKLYAIVCETLVIMDASGMDEKINTALKELAFNVAKAIHFDKGVKGNLMGGLDALIGLMGVSTNPY